MSDRRSQRIREQLRQHPNPRSGAAAAPSSLSAQLRRMYQPADTAQPQTVDHHAQLARQLAAQRKSRQ
jgi:hypothetical protein